MRLSAVAGRAEGFLCAPELAGRTALAGPPPGIPGALARCPSQPAVFTATGEILWTVCVPTIRGPGAGPAPSSAWFGELILRGKLHTVEQALRRQELVNEVRVKDARGSYSERLRPSEDELMGICRTIRTWNICADRRRQRSAPETPGQYRCPPDLFRFFGAGRRYAQSLSHFRRAGGLRAALQQSRRDSRQARTPMPAHSAVAW